MGIRISEMEEATTFGADDYVPIVTNGTNKKALGQKIKDFIAGFFATKTGDNISDKATFRSAIEISATNTPFDKTGTGMSAENVQAGIVELSGNRALIDGSNIGNQALFRENIGLGYSVSTQSYDGLTWTIVKLGKLYFLSTEITIPANTTPATVGNIYIYRGASKQWWNLPIEFTKKLCDISWTGGSPYAWSINYTDITSKMNTATSADVARSTQTASAITVQKFICGYVS